MISKMFYKLVRLLITDKMLINELKHRGHEEFTITMADTFGLMSKSDRMLQL